MAPFTPADAEMVNVLIAKVAVTLFVAFIVTAHVPVPLQAPDHPVKVDEAFGVAVRITDVPAANVPEQVVPQDIPAGAEVTAPLPVPAATTDSAYWDAGMVLLTSVAYPLSIWLVL
jgi:hypothetical protein